jgi:predicted nucleotidyltransferase
MERFQGQDSAFSIVMSLVNDTPRVISIQRELLEQNKSVDGTTAGKVIRELLREGRQESEQYQRREQKRIREEGC